MERIDTEKICENLLHLWFGKIRCLVTIKK